MAIKLWALTDLGGVSDLARKYGVNLSTVSNWRNRYEDFPEPLTSISGAPVFSFKQVAKWYRSKSWKKGKHDA